RAPETASRRTSARARSSTFLSCRKSRASLSSSLGRRSRAVPDLSQRAKHVTSGHLADVVIGVAMAHEPADDVREGLPGIFDAVDILDLLKLEAAAARRERELPCEEAVQANVVAEERIRSERDVLDANELRSEEHTS